MKLQRNMKATSIQISAVIFDMDGLMFDTERVAQAAWERAALEMGYSFPLGIFQGVIGSNELDVRRFTRRTFGPDFPFDEVYLRKQAYKNEYYERKGIPVKPGLLELLGVLEARKIAKAVASSSSCEIIVRNIQLAGLEPERFDALTGGDEVSSGKPAPDIFLTASRRLSVPGRQCLVLEDSNVGIEAAHAAGMVPVMIPDLIPPSQHVKQLAYRILSSLHGAKELIESL